MTRLSRRSAVLTGFGAAALVATSIAVVVATSGSAGASPFEVETTTRSDDYVPGDGVCADAAGRCSLRAALMEANELGGPAQVVLPAGTYPLVGPFEIENDVTISAAPAAATTPVIDLEDAPGFYVRTYDLVIDGVDVIDGLDTIGRGGAAIRAEEASVTIRNSTFRNHRSDTAGGAILSAYSVLNTENATFDANFSSSFGGAVAALGGDLLVATSTFENNGASGGGGAIHASALTRLDIGGSIAAPSAFTSNTALDQGGAVYVEGEPDPAGPTAKIGPATFAANSAGNEGGALFVGRAQGDHRTLVIDCTFTDNIGLTGGAVAVDFAQVDIERCDFTGNQSVGGSGGAVASGGSITLAAVDFDGNSADGDGGALAVNGPTELSDAAFVGNRATGFGGAMFTSGDAVPIIAATSMSGNAAEQGAGGIWRVGSPFDASAVTGSGNEPSGPLLVVATNDVPDPGPAPGPDPDPGPGPAPDPGSDPGPGPGAGPGPNPGSDTDPDPAPIEASLRPLTPVRLVETRAGEKTVDGEFQAIGRLGAGTVSEFQIGGRGGVDPDAAAVALNVTAVRPEAVGYVTLFPCGDRPLTSSLNHGAGGAVGNSAIVKLNDEGRLCAFTLAATDLVIDVNGWLAETDGFESLVSARLAETRAGEKTVDGQAQEIGRLRAGSITEIQIAGRGGVDAGADAVALNVTAIRPAGVGYVTLYPCDEDRPTTSSLNYQQGGAVGNSAVVSLSATGSLCAFTFADTDLVIDVNAWLADDESFDAFVPARIFETRAEESTIDDEFNGVGRLDAMTVARVQVGGRGGVPVGSSAVALNVTAIRPAGVGYVTLFPCDGDQPLTSSLNYSGGGAVGNSGVVKLAADGTLCAYTQTDSDLVIDVNAAWTNG